MERYTYLDFLAAAGIGSAHPGGFTLTKQLLQQLSLQPETKVLEIGCGTGRTAAYIKKQYGCHISTVEKNAVMLEKARDRWLKDNIHIDFVQGEAEQLPFQLEQFDVVLGESVFAFTKKARAINECYRVLKTGGMFICIEMVIEQHVSQQDEKKIVQVYGIDEILTELEWIEVFRKSGFQHAKVIGGATIAEAIATYAEQPEFQVSNHFPIELYETWNEHEHIFSTYQYVLGHRVFVCTK